MNPGSTLTMLNLRCLGDTQEEYQVCRLVTSLELERDLWTEDRNLSVYLKPGEHMRADRAGVKESDGPD